MTNAVPMGPPPSPKEPRRSGRRSVPSASQSKSPAGSPTSDVAPKPKENNNKANPPLSSNGGRTKKAKQEDLDDPLEDLPKNPTTNGRTKRKGKEKEKPVLAVDIHVDEYTQNGDGDAKDGAGDAPEDEEQGITRCPCEVLGEEDIGEGTMVMCEDCHAWQHGMCMGFPTEDLIPDSYFCEQCRPEMYPELIKRLKKARQAAAAHHVPAAQARNSRSHSPVSLMKQTKRRNTMNSRDAAYEQSLQAVIDASAAEALASSRVGQDADEGSVVGQGDVPHDVEVGPGGRKKRKRVDDDAASTKRTRSASIMSDRQAMPPPRDPTPMSVKASVPPSTAPKSTTRAKRPGGRKAQVQESMPPDGEEAGNTSTARRQGNPRAKANAGHEHGSRRTQVNGVSQVTAASTHAAAMAASRSYHNSHAYAVSQQPLLTSWNLPDYFAHLSHTLPTETPRPLEVRGFSCANGQEAMERTTERGVKVKWPGKRMSVGDMNKRVRALVEWVGREQASAMERSRRKEAIQKALKDIRASRDDNPPSATSADGGDVPMLLEGETVTQSPLQDKQPTTPSSALPAAPTVVDSLMVDSSSETMKMMEELMEELISFQERYGPGAKAKERERRTVS